MPFPDSPRVIYKKNPLEQVICQLRFPPILRIDTEVPANFQDAIRQEYPLFDEKQEVRDDLPPEVLAQIPPEFRRLFNISGRKAYDFKSLNEQWIVNLTRDFVALTANDYSTWEKFRTQFEQPFTALLNEYTLPLFTRVGLRYQNVIRRSQLGLEKTPWPDLLQPHIAGALAAPGIEEDSVLNSAQIIEIRLANDYGRVQLRHGFAVDDETGELCYLIDSDFFAEKLKESNDVSDRLDRFNRRAGRLFRWCITPRLHEAMGPGNI
jgi:uncharacterized protein (TIGR04255 family)